MPISRTSSIPLLPIQISRIQQPRLKLQNETTSNSKLPPPTIFSIKNNNFTIQHLHIILSEGQWLNDEIINIALACICRMPTPICTKGLPNIPKGDVRMASSFFFKKIDQLQDKELERQLHHEKLAGETLLNCRCILLPFHHPTAQHWSLFIIFPQQRSITHLDSLKSHGIGKKDMCWKVLQKFQPFLPEKMQRLEDWQVANIPSPQQHNGNDCGVHVVINAYLASSFIQPMAYKGLKPEALRVLVANLCLHRKGVAPFQLQSYFPKKDIR